MIELESEFAAQLPPGVDAFDYIMQLDGVMFRDMDSRRTLRFSLNDKRYFLKAHYGVGWKEIIKNLLQFRLPVLGARNEWRAIQRLQRLDVDTMRGVGYGGGGSNPARRQSFVITDALEETGSLEDFCADWEKHPVRNMTQIISRLPVQGPFSLASMFMYSIAAGRPGRGLDLGGAAPSMVGRLLDSSYSGAKSLVQGEELTETQINNLQRSTPLFNNWMLQLIEELPPLNE